MEAFETNLNSLLVDTFNSILRYEETALKSMSPSPVTVTEAHVLEAVGKQDGGSMVSEIAAALRIALPTATVAIKKLEQKGFLTKTACTDDARRFIVSLTDAGKRIDRAHALFHTRMVRNISREFSDEEKDVLLRAVQKLQVFFDGLHPQGADA